MSTTSGTAQALTVRRSTIASDVAITQVTGHSIALASTHSGGIATRSFLLPAPKDGLQGWQNDQFFVWVNGRLTKYLNNDATGIYEFGVDDSVYTAACGPRTTGSPVVSQLSGAQINGTGSTGSACTDAILADVRANKTAILNDDPYYTSANIPTVDTDQGGHPRFQLVASGVTALMSPNGRNIGASYVMGIGTVNGVVADVSVTRFKSRLITVHSETLSLDYQVLSSSATSRTLYWDGTLSTRSGCGANSPYQLTVNLYLDKVYGALAAVITRLPSGTCVF